MVHRVQRLAGDVLDHRAHGTVVIGRFVHENFDFLDANGNRRLHPPTTGLDQMHHVTKHLQQRIESDHFRLKKDMPKIGGFQSFNTTRRTIAGFEALLWLRKGFGFSGEWPVNDQQDLLGRLFGLQKINKARKCY